MRGLSGRRVADLRAPAVHRASSGRASARSWPVSEWKPGHLASVHGRVTRVVTHFDGRVRVTIDPKDRDAERVTPCQWCNRATRRGAHIPGCPHDSLTEWPDDPGPPEWMVKFPPLDEVDHSG